jgi:mannose-6-phosphate isomerase-like protein (cupin superfamily)
VMSGRGVMTVDEEERPVGPGDLVYIPPDQVHSLRPVGGGAIHCFCFAVGVKGAAVVDSRPTDAPPARQRLRSVTRIR